MSEDTDILQVIYVLIIDEDGEVATSARSFRPNLGEELDEEVDACISDAQDNYDSEIGNSGARRIVVTVTKLPAPKLPRTMVTAILPDEGETPSLVETTIA